MEAELIERYRAALEQIDFEGREVPKHHHENRSEAWDDGYVSGLYRAGEHARAALASDCPEDDDEDQEPDSDRTLGLCLGRD